MKIKKVKKIKIGIAWLACALLLSSVKHETINGGVYKGGHSLGAPPYTQTHITTIYYNDQNEDGLRDAGEERVYRTATHLDGTFALEMEAGSYDIYAKY